VHINILHVKPVWKVPLLKLAIQFSIRANRLLDIRFFEFRV